MGTTLLTITHLEDKSLIENLLQLYLHDFSEIEAIEINKNGLFEYKDLDLFWKTENRHALLARQDGKPVGFALVQKGNFNIQKDAQDEDLIDMVEFFVLRRHRRKGIGREMAIHCFNLFQGAWQVRTDRQNPGAVLFWEKVIREYSPSGYEKVSSQKGARITYYFGSN